MREKKLKWSQCPNVLAHLQLPPSCSLLPFFSSKHFLSNMPRAVRGLLIECDPSIKSMILKYDEERHDYIVEDLDDENHLVIKESQLQNLKVRLDQDLDEKIMQLDESESE
ncbi:unnamed protein product [Penicillium nalgiovense]|uniref:General transcription and DNA repair factor IIH subunit TFB5 n=1 Tax=Penicillium nalgiovense TaxID=60175 RepID=A0A9W4MM98_PENNA|nr:unnamed protein product [Penicillium nalgiovense]CAG7948958.1 unnamed protein product [Penicillium nalgiovense]CAG7957865.1 unnamed protein product [Penicillium nalgiovense]CAG7976208.1 unnamed protein product [Penicillium nalgiovense]CAG7989862.1 unnamed protein product [Penicillium nalgiovense]